MRALFHYLIAEAYRNGRFHEEALALHYAVSPLLYIGDIINWYMTSQSE